MHSFLLSKFILLIASFSMLCYINATIHLYSLLDFSISLFLMSDESYMKRKGSCFIN